MDNETRDWAEQVTTVLQRLKELETERQEAEAQLKALRTGSPSVPPTPRLNSTHCAEGTAPLPPPGLHLSLPTSGTAKRVYDFMTSHPGAVYTPGRLTEALGLDPDRKSVVNTALSRLFRAKVLDRQPPGEYVFPLIVKLPGGGLEVNNIDEKA